MPNLPNCRNVADAFPAKVYENGVSLVRDRRPALLGSRLSADGWYPVRSDMMGCLSYRCFLVSKV